MLKGEDGFQRKEFEKLLEWLASEPPPDVIQLPNALLRAWRRRFDASSSGPVHCTLQGEDLFLDGLHKTHRDEALALIRAERGVRRSVHRRQRVLRGLHGAAICRFRARRLTSCRSASTSTGSRRRRDSARGGRSPSAISRGSRRKRACTRCATRTCGSGRCRASDGAQLEVAGYLAPDQQDYLKEAERRLDQRRVRRRVSLPRRRSIASRRSSS